MIRVCFATPGVLPMLRKAPGTVYGGSELRAWRFARGLAGRDFEVSIAAAGSGRMPTDELGPVRVPGPDAERGWLSRLAAPLGRRQSRDEALWSAANADIYVAFGAAEYNADLADWCKANERPLLLFAGSDADFSADYRPGNSARNMWGSRCDRCFDSVVGATAIVVQTEFQRRSALERYGRDADVVVNPIPVSELADRADAEVFLWIGKAVPNKRPDLVLEIARACPDHMFVMILNDVGNGVFETISRDKASNVEIIRSVAPDDLGAYFARATALLCTSDFEGFPNTFLDAGRFGVPVLSLTVDPDGLVTREQGGFIANGKVDRLIDAVADYGRDYEKARLAGSRWRDYVRRCHDLDGRVAEFAAIVRRTVRSGASVKAMS